MANIALLERVQNQINLDVQNGKVDPIQLQSMLLILSEAKNENEIEIALDVFADQFPTFETVLTDIETDEIEEDEIDVQKIVSRIIKEDPKFADEVAKYALDKKVSADELKAQFPNIDNYLN